MPFEATFSAMWTAVRSVRRILGSSHRSPMVQVETASANYAASRQEYRWWRPPRRALDVTAEFGCDRLKCAHESGLAVVASAHLAHGILPVCEVGFVEPDSALRIGLLKFVDLGRHSFEAAHKRGARAVVHECARPERQFEVLLDGVSPHRPSGPPGLSSQYILALRIVRTRADFDEKSALCLHFAYYNFCRIHKSLRVTPAMETGIADHVWTIRELLA